MSQEGLRGKLLACCYINRQPRAIHEDTICVVCTRGNKRANAGVELEYEKKLQGNGLKREVLAGQVPEETLKERNKQRDQSSEPVRLNELCNTSPIAVTSNCSTHRHENNVEMILNGNFYSEVGVLLEVNDRRWLQFVGMTSTNLVSSVDACGISHLHRLDPVV
jgi:hypothetical protein